MERDRESIRSVSFVEGGGRRTTWGRDGAMRVLAGCYSGKRSEDAHPGGGTPRGHESVNTTRHSGKRSENAHSGGGTGQREHQQGVIREREETTHNLGVERGHESISRVSFIEEKRQRTNWGVERGRESISRVSFGTEKRRPTNWK